MNRIFILLLFLLSLSTTDFPQENINDSQNYSDIIRTDFLDFFHTGQNLFTQPLRWKEKEWFYFGSTITATALLFFIDNETGSFARRNISDFNDALFSADNLITGVKSLIIPTTIYFYGFFGNDNSARKIGLKSAEALIYSYAITQFLKISFGRARPFLGKGNRYFKPFKNQDSYFSLPSGHATAAFAMASVFSSAYDNLFWDIFCYGSATIISLARVYHDKHWFSDIFLGGIIGYSTGSFISNYNSGKIYSGKLHIVPIIGFNSLGIQARF